AYAPPSGQRSGYPGQQYHQQGGGYPGQYGGPPPPPGNHQYGGHPMRPPMEQQNYGPTFQGQSGRDVQPYFQYSQCTGKKKALSIGINYFGQNGELRGCINDSHNITNFLVSNYGYDKADIVMLTDDATNPRQQPTRENILAAMQWLVRGAAPDDSLFFHYSGHGGQTKDLDGDEGDGFDEVIYPVDYQEAGHIVDDEMHDIMVKSLPAGCRLTAIFDSCHSGSALDLPYLYSTEGKLKEPNLAAEAGQGLLAAATSYARGDMGGMLSSAMGIFKAATTGKEAEKISKATKTSPADCISWSGCKDSQTSADAEENGQATGAMSYAFIAALSMSYLNLRESLD
ncbi:Ca(2+)-dependent cysteine protease, partial [Sphagnurus paluster]